MIMGKINNYLGLIFGVGLVCSMTVVYGRPHHHMRHQDLVTEALRERLGLANNNMQSGDDNVVPTKTLQMRVVSPQELISTIRSSVRSIPEHHHGLFDSHSHLGARFGALGLGTGLNGEDGMQMQMNTVRQLVMAALNHVLQNLQTVEGGQEAARWLTALRGNDPVPQPTQKTLVKTTTEKNSESNAPIMIQLHTTSTTSTTTTTTASPPQSNDEENKVDSNL